MEVAANSSKRKADDLDSNDNLHELDVTTINEISDHEQDSCGSNPPKIQTPPPPPTRPAETCFKGYREQCLRYANLTLDYFNEKSHTKYELVEDETMESKRFFDNRGVWIHCNFKAKDPSIKQFFGEINRIDGLAAVVTTCKILEGKTDAGCYFCGSFIAHPVCGYKAGYPADYESLELEETDEPEYSVFAYDEEAGVKLGEKDEDSKMPGSPPTRPVEDCSEGYRKQCVKYAKLAMDYFNEKNHTKYELVEDETMESKFFHDNCGCWIHCNFKAKDSSIKQFFGEINRVNDGPERVVTTCKILKGKTHAGCYFCSSFILHPVYGYKGGYPADYESLGLRSRSKLESEETDEPEYTVL